MKTKEQLDKEAKENNEELIHRTDVKDTPFTIITLPKKQFGVMGEYRVTEPLTYRNEKEKKANIKKLKDDLQRVTWNRIIQIITIINKTEFK